MKNAYVFLVLLLLLTAHPTFSQFKLVEEKYDGNKLSLTIVLMPPKFTINKKEGMNYIKFGEYVDESKPGSFQIPKSELFIALPSSQEPKIVFSSQKSKVVDALPSLNPLLKSSKDGRLIFEELEEWDRIPNPEFTNHGVIRLEKNWCLHLSVFNYKYDQLIHSLDRLDEIKIQLIFNSSIRSPQKRLSRGSAISDLIINKEFARENISEQAILYKNENDVWIDYTKDYIKMGVGKDGTYRLSYNQLFNHIKELNQIDPSTFQIFCKGKEIPIFVKGEGDLKFDVSDYIEFIGLRNYGGQHRKINDYNTPYNEYIDRYNDTTVVWLTWGKQKGLRVKVHQIAPGTGTTTINYYNHFLHYEENIWFDFSTDQLVRRQLPEWIENETWGWRNQGNGNLDLPFTVSNIVQNKIARAYIKIQSYAADVEKRAHRVGLRVNSNTTVYDSLFFDRNKQRLINAVFNSNLLTNGNNRISSISFPTKASLNSVYHDWYEIEYPRALLMSGDSIVFRFYDYTRESQVNYEIDGYKNSPISLYRYSDMYDVTRISNQNINGAKIVFTDITDSTMYYSIVPESKTLLPQIYSRKKFINLRSSGNTADYLIITHPSLNSTVSDYSSFIASNYNRLVKIVSVYDVYDEFNYGFYSPEPIKDFLQYVYSNWTAPKLEYVLLLGSANYDYYEHRNKQLPAPPHPNLVPSFGVPVSDYWFINWEKNKVFNPLIKIGRLPARTNEDVRLYLAKHKNFISQKYSELNKKYLFFSGGLGNSQSELDQLRNTNQYVLDNYVKKSPIGGIGKLFYKTLSPNTNFGPYSISEIQNSIDSSGVFISYLGHSGTQTWDNSITDVKQLKNKVGANPLVTDFGCSTAKFAEPDVTSFSEGFVMTKDGDAIAYIGNTSLGFTSSSLVAPNLFYETVLKDSVLSISEALTKSKLKLLAKYGDTDVNKLFFFTNTLVGDPIISLKIPTKPNLNMTQSNFRIEKKSFTSLDDSVSISVNFKNLGRVINKSFRIVISDQFDNQKVFETNMVRSIPLLNDSTKFNLPVKNRAGSHTITVKLDSDSQIDELSEDDNLLETNIFVTNSAVRDLSLSESSYTSSELKLLNPITKQNDNYLDVQISESPLFANPQISKNQYGEVLTKIDLTKLQLNKRFWIQIKPGDQSAYSFTKTFLSSPKSGILLNDSVSFRTGICEKLIIGKGVKLGNERVSIEAISAGFNDGNTGVVTVNNQNYIPFPNRGHNMCVFDGESFELKSFYQFDLLFGGQAAQTNYQKALDDLKLNDVFAIVIVDEGFYNLNATLKRKLLELGSKYVDSISFRSSWAFVGRKGTIPQNISEGFSKLFSGRAIAKSLFEKRVTHGRYTSELFGPVTQWNKLEFEFSKPNNSKIFYSLLGKNSTSAIDTIMNGELSNTIIDLSNEKFKKYPYLKVIAQLNAGSSSESPELKSVYLSYKALPELGTNYQVVSISKDSLDQGETTNLDFSVYNVGESTASNFKVRVDLVKKDNTKERLFEQVVDSIQTEKKKDFSFTYTTDKLTGSNQFQITIDPDNSVTELYKDNNFYSVPFFVKPNNKPATLRLTIDGSDIINGDFISSKPNFKIELSDESLIPITDTTKILLYLNNKRIYFASNNNIINYNYSSSNPKMVVNYTPTLADGDYTFKVVGKNATDQIIDSSGTVRKFTVRNELQLLNAYNYPNPFKDDTYFTFKLTQIPDELKIIIYTIAGRKIKEIKLSAAELKFDFNRIFWDGRDQDGDLAANGVYLYKIISQKGSEKTELTQKLSVLR